MCVEISVQTDGIEKNNKQKPSKKTKIICVTVSHDFNWFRSDKYTDQ